MDKTAIKNFAVEARKLLMKTAITEAGFYGITNDGCKEPVQKGNDFEVYETVAGTENRIFGDDIKRRANLVQAINTLGFEQVIEETAYTWFNRIIAIRFMEVNNYLPTRVRVLSSETGSGTPDIITQADTVELNLTSDEIEKIQTAKRENRYDDAFRMLFIKQCNELNAILPGLFEKTDDYMELLLKITYTGDGVVRMLVDSIPADNFNVEAEGQVEIIGWMYQYYNTELKDDTFAKLKKNVKITKERVPAATQLFTPDWIVRYMVENSLGRVWIEHLRAVDPSVDEKAKAEEFGWKYYLPEAEQEDDVKAQLVEIRKSYKDLAPQDITCIDPCMGSGHILVYMFDVLMDIYRSEGFSEREAVFDVLEKNIRGLDIDRRAYQLSYFALMMKARGYNRIFFRGHDDIDGNRVQASPKVYAIEESNSIDRSVLQYYGAGLGDVEKNNAFNQVTGLIEDLNDAKEYGSILNVERYDWNLIRRFINGLEDEGQLSLINYSARQLQSSLLKLAEIGEMLSNQFYAVVTNPPYMNSSGMNAKLLSYIKRVYPNSKSDISFCFMERCASFCNNNGFYSMINIPVWMNLSSCEEFRKKIIKNENLCNLLHFGRGVFGSDFGSCAFVFRESRIKEYKTIFRKLYNQKGSVDNVDTKEEMFFENKWEYLRGIDDFANTPGSIFSYTLTVKGYELFVGEEKIGKYATARQGMATADNNRFLRCWYEVSQTNTTYSCTEDKRPNDKAEKWVPYSKGGAYRKWYGNNDYVLNWQYDGSEIRAFKKSVVRNPGFYFKKGLTWTALTAGSFSMRYQPTGFAFDSMGPVCFPFDEKNIYTVLGILNSCVGAMYLEIMCPNFKYDQSPIENVPFVEDERENIIRYVKENIDLAKEDWDAFETSWDFLRHPLISASDSKDCLIEQRYNSWVDECDKRFASVKGNEEALNRILINAYGLNNELNPEVEDKEVTINRADLSRDIKGLISYAVGCMFGRYSLDEDGLVFAGGEYSQSRYHTFIPDEDAIIPITDEPYFQDDIVERFVEFVRVAYGDKYLEENLQFIAKALGGKEDSSRDIIRNYFLNDFYKDHCSMYSLSGTGKRPIYWLFDSGKQNGFKCLIYMHRYSANTVGIIRSDYLTRVQGMIENALKNADYAINTSTSAVDKAQATKKRDKYIKQLAEIRAYYPALSHIALQRIELDLDDGVKANYAKFQGIEVSVEGEKKQKVDLLAKI